MKTVLFVPGFKENLRSRNYRSTIKAIENKGYKVKFVNINWQRTVADDWVEQLSREYLKHDPKETILAGFSFGSFTAFVVAANITPNELWLFSLSPYFKEDIPKLKKAWKNYIGHRRVTAFEKFNFTNLAKKIKCKTLIIYGEKEASRYPMILNRSLKANEIITKNKLVVAPKVGHDVSNLNYVQTISANI